MFPMFFLCLRPTEDRDLLFQIYTRYERLMYATAGRYTTLQQEKEDIVQDALVKMVSCVERLRQLDGCALTSFVVILTRNTAVNHVKHLGVIHKHRTCDGWDSDTIPVLPALSVEDMIALSEIRDCLNRVWPLLPGDDCLLLEGRYLLGLNDAELAELVGCKPDSVRMKLSRARRNAMAEMKRSGYEYDPS